MINDAPSSPSADDAQRASHAVERPDDVVEAVESADIAAGTALASHRHDPVVQAGAKIGKLGDQEPLYAASAVTILAGFLAGNTRLRNAGLYALAAVAAADAGKSLAKRSLHRTRPHVLLDEHRYERGVGGIDEKPAQSFPSGHTAGAVAVARAISRHYPASLLASVPFTFVVALSRIAKGAHWPLDVAAGTLIGLAVEAISSRFLCTLGIKPRRRR